MVENVYVYVADSLRWDHLPAAVADRGVAFKTVAQSTFSAPSFATLVTGRYPQQHGVLDWNDRPPESVPTVLELDGIDGGFWQAGEVAGHEIFPILRQTGKTDPADLEAPFVFVERNDDPHVPFAGTAPSSSAEYYQSRGRDWERIREEYRQGVEESAAEFERRLDELADRGLLEDTLVVFTSDHGELLGEHGEVAHTSPACPELTYVPTVLVHDDLSAADLHASPGTDVVEHVDVVATMLGALGRGDAFETAGVDLRERARQRDWGYSHVDLQRLGRSMYAADGAWWHGGGHVVHRSPMPHRTAAALHRLARSPSRAAVDPLALLRSYLPSTATFDDPPVPLERARDLLDEFRADLDTVEARSVDLDENVEQTLEDMGYL